MIDAATNAELFHDTVRAIARAMDLDRTQRLHHARRVAVVAHRLAIRLDLPRPATLYYAGLLHEVGPGCVGDEAGQCPRESVRIVEPFEPMGELATIIGDHRERYDGNGLPTGKGGSAISLEAGVLRLADDLEQSIRARDPSRRIEEALCVARAAAGTTCHPAIAGAAMGLLHEGDLLDALYDPSGLDRLEAACSPSPSDLAGLSDVELVTQALWLFARVVDERHLHRGGHSVRVAFYALQIAEQVGGLGRWDTLWGGLLHDVGLLGVPYAVLSKPCRLTPAEMGLVRTHAEDSRSIVASMHHLSHLAGAVGAHHERYDGHGYPSRAAGEAIPLLARVLAYADAYEGLTAGRPHRAKVEHAEAIRHIERGVGTHFDPHIASLALEVLEACGPLPRELPTTVRAFHEFFGTDLFDVRPLLAPSDSSRDGRPGGQGALLLELAPWHAASLTADLGIEAGAEPLGRLVGGLGDRLDDHFDAASMARLAAMASELERGGVATRYLFGHGGRPFEVILSPRPSGYELLYRSAEHHTQSLGRMALFYRNFLNSAEAVCFTDADERILDVNTAFLSLYGYRLRDVIGQPLRMVWSDRNSPDLYDGIRETLRDPRVGSWSGEGVHLMRDGSDVPVLLTATTMRDANGALVGLVCRARDISERKRAERELQEKNEELERLDRLKSDLVAVASHDLRAPLNTIISYARALRLRAGVLPKAAMEQTLDKIVDAGTKLVQFVNDILDLERMRVQGDPTPPGASSVEAALEASVEVNTGAAEEAGVTLTISAVDPSLSVSVAPHRLEQVCGNLVQNAIKHTPRGGRVVLSAARSGQDHVRIHVTDEGPGIPAGEIQAIFEAFHQVERARDVRHGFGLGLHIVKSIVALHGGRAWAENLPVDSARARPEGRDAAVGCRFTVELPMATPRASPPAAMLVDPRGALGSVLGALSEVGARYEFALDADEIAAAAASFQSGVVFAHVPSLAPAEIAALAAMRERRGRAVILVAVGPDPAAADGFDRALTEPVLAIEVLELLKELEIDDRSHRR